MTDIITRVPHEPKMPYFRNEKRHQLAMHFLRQMNKGVVPDDWDWGHAEVAISTMARQGVFWTMKDFYEQRRAWMSQF